MSDLYFLIQEGRLYATHHTDRLVVIGTRRVDTIFELRRALVRNIETNNQLLTKYKSASKHPLGQSLRLTGASDTSRESVKYKYMGVCKIPFDLIRDRSLIKRLFDFAEADLFVVEEVVYRSDWNFLTVNGIRLDRESYRSQTLSADSYKAYLQGLIEIS